MSKNTTTTITISSSDADPEVSATMAGGETSELAPTPLASPGRRQTPRDACVIPRGDELPVCGELVELDGVPLGSGTDDDR